MAKIIYNNSERKDETVTNDVAEIKEQNAAWLRRKRSQQSAQGSHKPIQQRFSKEKLLAWSDSYQSLNRGDKSSE